MRTPNAHPVPSASISNQQLGRWATRSLWQQKLIWVMGTSPKGSEGRLPRTDEVKRDCCPGLTASPGRNGRTAAFPNLILMSSGGARGPSGTFPSVPRSFYSSWLKLASCSLLWTEWPFPMNHQDLALHRKGLGCVPSALQRAYRTHVFCSGGWTRGVGRVHMSVHGWTCLHT